MLGRRVAILADGVRSPGHHEIEVDGRNLGAGVYIYRLATPQGQLSRTLQVVR
ncbi:MAG: hypothetical protein ACI80V_003834 [Rhodothermales bacterium]|jgi:hypothetical protein